MHRRYQKAKTYASCTEVTLHVLWDYNCEQTDAEVFRCQVEEWTLVYTHISTHLHSQEQRSGKTQLTLVWEAGRSWQSCTLSEEGNHIEPINMTKVIRFQHQCPAESDQLLYSSEMTDGKYDSNKILESKPQSHTDIYQPWCTKYAGKEFDTKQGKNFTCCIDQNKRVNLKAGNVKITIKSDLKEWKKQSLLD